LVPLLFFAGLELGLRAVGWGVKTWIRLQRPDPGERAGASIVCAGDSVTFGLNADTDQAYPMVLAGLPGFEDSPVHGVGVPGIDSQGLAVQLERELAGRPELGGGLLLVLVGYNDCAQLPGMMVGGAGQVAPSSGPRDLLLRSHSYQLLTQAVLRLRPPGPPPQPGVAPGGVPDTAGDLGRCAGVLAHGLDELEGVAAGYDLSLMLVAYPVPAERSRGTPLATSRINRMMATEAAERGLPWLDIEPCVSAREATAAPGFFSADGIHMDAHGYAALAACVAAALEPWRGAPSGPAR